MTLNQKDPFNWLVRANVFMNLELINLANLCYYWATRKGKRMGEAWAGLIITYEMKGDDFAAGFYLKKGLKKCKNDYQLLCKKAERLIDEWQLKEAEETLWKSFGAIGSENLAKANYLMGRMHMAARRYSEAEAFFRGASLYEPRNTEYRHSLAKAFYKQGKDIQASKILSKITSKEPDNEEAWKLRKSIVNWAYGETRLGLARPISDNE